MNFAIIEIHDITPRYYEETVRAIELISLCGVEKYSLLVVPNYWDENHLCKKPDFVSAILSTGQEVVLHGYNHKGGNIKDFFWTYKEGEFSGLDLFSTYRKISKALEIFKALHIKTSFFVPPAWIGNPYLEDVLYSLGFKGVAYRTYIKHLDTDTIHTSPTITFSNRALLSSLSVAFIPLMFRMFKNRRILRLALHTRDFRDKRKIKLWRLLLTKVKKLRRLVSYEELFSQSGLASSLQSV
jgi:predicted deacetylase